YKIFIDTCSILEDGNSLFWEKMSPYLKDAKSRVFIAQRVIDELDKHVNQKKDPSLAAKASEAKKLLAVLQQADLIDIRGEASDGFADNVFLVVFTKFRLHHNLLLITQDRKLTADIEALNQSQSVKSSKRIEVRKIAVDGSLVPISAFRSEGSKSKPTSALSEKTDVNAFKLSSQVTSIPKTPLKLTHNPLFEDTFQDETGKQVWLKEQIASGGEGIIYRTNSDLVAKIYKPDQLNQWRFEKIKLMLTRQIDEPGISYPRHLLFNALGEFVGYLMPEARGKELQRSLFIKPLLYKNFPNWKKNDTVRLCLTILEKINYLHNRNIILGDINPANILIVSPTEVYFVDTDSYQIEGFPCPVGTINFTAPEIQRKSFDSFLRTFDQERFAVATLLFMIMLPGKSPYAQQGGENPIDNIINMDFSYPFGDRSNKKTPEGPWRYIWSHLPYALKKLFYETFRKGESLGPGNRLALSAWYDQFSEYERLLVSGILTSQDEMAMELFPTRLKKIAKLTYKPCRLCHEENVEGQLVSGICRACLPKGEYYNCDSCDEMILYTNEQRLVKQQKRFSICRNCHDKRNEVWTHVVCGDCGARFGITNSEHDYFAAKGLHVPKRCESCRRERRTNGRSVPKPPPVTPVSKSSEQNDSSAMGSILKILANFLSR
ncbi:zinc-ribbon domain containing protein, partial [Exiguobacterium sp. TNDT2]|uniref:zinc-ribbon domain containing protein n=1 Tax=Exiguobacterium sp. TNDT2 TaxID=2233531 RepID=UPI000DEF357A